MVKLAQVRRNATLKVPSLKARIADFTFVPYSRTNEIKLFVPIADGTEKDVSSDTTVTVNSDFRSVSPSDVLLNTCERLMKLEGTIAQLVEQDKQKSITITQLVEQVNEIKGDQLIRTVIERTRNTLWKKHCLQCNQNQF